MTVCLPSETGPFKDGVKKFFMNVIKNTVINLIILIVAVGYIIAGLILTSEYRGWGFIATMVLGCFLAGIGKELEKKRIMEF
ncbi:MAG: hypothetical protein NTX14_01825 [Candidatus Nealsonbacteria bacterium]|nr:hypothetical protein [Candidatus Nealsonbacteria bacterium]